MLKKVIGVLLTALLVLQMIVPTIVVANDGYEVDDVLVYVGVIGNEHCILPDVMHAVEVGSEFFLSAEGCDPLPGYRFSHWTSDQAVEFLDATASTTSFIVPEGGAVIRLVFVPEENGNTVSIAVGATPGESCDRHTSIYTYEVGAVKLLSTCNPLEGFRFSHWESSHDAVEFEDAFAPSTTFIVPDVDFISITAVFLPDSVTTEPEPTEPEPTDPEPTNPESTDPKTTDPKTTEPSSTSPTVTTEPSTTTPSITEPSSGSNNLPQTGAVIANLGLVGTALIGVGATLTTLNRKRK